jgi:hypothetical protein
MMDRALDAAMKYVAEGGVTSVVHMGTWDDLEVLRRARGRQSKVHKNQPLPCPPSGG